MKLGGPAVNKSTLLQSVSNDYLYDFATKESMNGGIRRQSWATAHSKFAKSLS
jgi:hypothetical protein